MATSWPQDGPRWAQDGPKMAPRSLQDGPRRPQDGSKTVPRRLQATSETNLKLTDFSLLTRKSQDTPKWPPRGSHEAPKRRQGVAKRGQEASKKLPRGSQEAPKRHLRGIALLRLSHLGANVTTLGNILASACTCFDALSPERTSCSHAKT